jgi:hypothetical protein
MRNPLAHPKFKDDEVVVATTSGAFDGVPGVVLRGQQLRGNHPAVKNWPQFFVPFGTPSVEWPPEGNLAAIEKIEEERHRESDRMYPQIPPEEAVVCIQDFQASAFAPVSAGDRRRRSDPIVKKFPQYFGELPVPLVKA